jgi:putative phosphoesterase
MNVGILSDTHCHLDERILDAMQECNVIVHAGDIGNQNILERLQIKKRKIVAVRGNNDEPRKWPRHQHAFLHALPFEQTLELPGGDLVVVHGHKQRSAAHRHQQLRARYPWARAIVYGHSHRLVLDQAQEPWVLNPGAAGKARTYGGPSCILLHINRTGWQVKSIRFAKVSRT